MRTWRLVRTRKRSRGSGEWQSKGHEQGPHEVMWDGVLEGDEELVTGDKLHRRHPLPAMAPSAAPRCCLAASRDVAVVQAPAQAVDRDLTSRQVQLPPRLPRLPPPPPPPHPPLLHSPPSPPPPAHALTCSISSLTMSSLQLTQLLCRYLNQLSASCSTSPAPHRANPNFFSAVGRRMTSPSLRTTKL